MRRVIYSLAFELEPVPPESSHQLIVPLNADGQSANGFARPGQPKTRIIDLRIGDSIWHGRNVHKIIGVKAYRDAMLADGVKTREGYVVRG